MNTSIQWHRYLLPCAIAAAVMLFGGCGSESDQPVLVDARTLLDQYQQQRLRHDPRHFCEVELGEFFVTQRRGSANYTVRFTLYAVVADQQRELLEQQLQSHHSRVQEAIRSTMQEADPAKLQKNTLDWIKPELISAINHCLQERLVRDVAFADFAFDRI